MPDTTILTEANARFVRLMAPECDDVLAEVEALNREREFFERGGFADRAAFEAAREKLASGGVIIADNTMKTAETVDLGTVNEYLSGGDPEMNETTAGVAGYFDAIRSDPEFETVALPVDEGITASPKA